MSQPQLQRPLFLFSIVLYTAIPVTITRTITVIIVAVFIK